MTYSCCDEQRRTAVLLHPTLNGIDFLEIGEDQTTLIVHFLKAIAPGSLQAGNVLIEGGERIGNIDVTGILYGSLASPLSPPDSPPGSDDRIAIVSVKEAGDFSQYTLKLVQDDEHPEPPEGFDPVLSEIIFSFKVLCPSDFDCKPQHECAPEQEISPDINYLAKDYQGFRQLMLDRLSLLAPQWKERNVADPGVMMVELLAYVGDYLSYRQDAIATEAYLGTARSRISVRRHARLVDYPMHDGSNARTWVHIDVAPGTPPFTLPMYGGPAQANTKFLTKAAQLPQVMLSSSRLLQQALHEGVKVFEPLHDVVLNALNNRMDFYTWGQADCCLPKGATSATLDTHLPLQEGQVLIFCEVLGPRTGKAGDADPARRHAVLLTRVQHAADPLGRPFDLPPDYTPRPVTEISWHADDALPFPLCITATDDNGRDIVVSVALGNNVLADHGRTLTEILPAVPVRDDEAANNISIIKPSSDPCIKSDRDPIPLRYNPKLQNGPLTQASLYDAAQSAMACMNRNITGISPAIYLDDPDTPDEWVPVRDLIASNRHHKHFVAEVESNGIASLRFGNDTHGQRPAEGKQLTAVYRVGNGVAGNVGAMVLTHLVCDDASVSPDKILSIYNPLPATGGTEMESIEVVRNRAPVAFRRQERAVTMADYEQASRKAMPGIQRSAATLRWTGSWRTVFLTVDRLGGKTADAGFEEALRNGMEKYRMAGQDLEVDNPLYVSLEIDMTVCVKPHYFRSQVKAALLDVLSNRLLPDGRPGLFHPDNFTFGQPVYLSAVYAAAQQVEGVSAVTIQKFQRQGQDSNDALQSGELFIGRREIARLDNDRNFPERGVLHLTLEGGK